MSTPIKVWHYKRAGKRANYTLCARQTRTVDCVRYHETPTCEGCLYSIRVTGPHHFPEQALRMLYQSVFEGSEL